MEAHPPPAPCPHPSPPDSGEDLYIGGSDCQMKLDVVIGRIPQVTLTGYVQDCHGRRVEHALVRLYRYLDPCPHPGRLVEVDHTRTDRHGCYRFVLQNICAGHYRVVVSSPPPKPCPCPCPCPPVCTEDCRWDCPPSPCPPAPCPPPPCCHEGCGCGGYCPVPCPPIPPCPPEPCPPEPCPPRQCYTSVGYQQSYVPPSTCKTVSYSSICYQ